MLEELGKDNGRNLLKRRKGCPMNYYTGYAVEEIINLCRIPSPSGFTRRIEEYISGKFDGLGFKPVFTNKRCILVDLGGEGNGLAITAHYDTLGAMVRSIKTNGRIRFSKIGGFPENFIEGENCTIYTRSGREYSGSVQFNKTPPHLYTTKTISETKRDDENIEIVIDEKVRSKEDAKLLDINTGDFIAFDPRTVYTGSGFIKSRYLDDKAACAILISLAKYVREKDIKLNREGLSVF